MILNKYDVEQVNEHFICKKLLPQELYPHTTVIKQHVLQDIVDGHTKATGVLQKAEKEVIDCVMVKCRWNQVQAAIALGISRGTLRRKLKDLFGTKYIK